MPGEILHQERVPIKHDADVLIAYQKGGRWPPGWISRLFGTLRGQGAGVPNLLGYPRAKPEQVRASDTLSREIPETRFLKHGYSSGGGLRLESSDNFSGGGTG